MYVGNALSPARVQNVHIDLAERVADVFVPTDMVSLAIGKEGQNSRLAARLTGFKINIRDAAEPLEARDVAGPEDVATVDVPEGAEETGDVEKSDSEQSLVGATDVASALADEASPTDSGADVVNEDSVSVETGETTSRKPAGSED